MYHQSNAPTLLPSVVLLHPFHMLCLSGRTTERVVLKVIHQVPDPSTCTASVGVVDHNRRNAILSCTTVISRFSASFRLWIHGSYSRDSSKNNAPLIPLRLITLTDSDSSLVTRSCIVVLLVL